MNLSLFPPMSRSKWFSRKPNHFCRLRKGRMAALLCKMTLYWLRSSKIRCLLSSETQNTYRQGSQRTNPASLVSTAFKEATLSKWADSSSSLKTTEHLVCRQILTSNSATRQWKVASKPQVMPQFTMKTTARRRRWRLIQQSLILHQKNKFNAKSVGMMSRQVKTLCWAHANAMAALDTYITSVCLTGSSRKWHWKRRHIAPRTPGSNSSARSVKRLTLMCSKPRDGSIGLSMWSYRVRATFCGLNH